MGVLTKLTKKKEIYSLVRQVFLTINIIFYNVGAMWDIRYKDNSIYNSLKIQFL